jgi:hypothetical protein
MSNHTKKFRFKIAIAINNNNNLFSYLIEILLFTIINWLNKIKVFYFFSHSDKYYLFNEKATK